MTNNKNRVSSNHRAAIGTLVSASTCLGLVVIAEVLVGTMIL